MYQCDSEGSTLSKQINASLDLATPRNILPTLDCPSHRELRSFQGRVLKTLAYTIVSRRRISPYQDVETGDTSDGVAVRSIRPIADIGIIDANYQSNPSGYIRWG